MSDKKKLRQDIYDVMTSMHNDKSLGMDNVPCDL
jgi:hypothetical protein